MRTILGFQIVGDAWKTTIGPSLLPKMVHEYAIISRLIRFLAGKIRLRKLSSASLLFPKSRIQQIRNLSIEIGRMSQVIRPIETTSKN